MAIATNLRDYRKASGLKQSELAEKIGVSQKTVSSWETGRTEPTMKDVASICSLLDVSVDQLAGTKARAVGEITYEDLLVKIRSLDLDELKELLHIVRDTIATKEEIERLTLRQAEQEKIIREYAEKIKELENKIM